MFKRKKTKVAVGLSGGVDSSVAALLLSQNPKYEVVGVYMRNWSEELPEIKGCPWEADQRDAQLVAAKLDIPFYVVNFEKEYYDRVVEYMIDTYKNGQTPNPDIMCNQEIKFGVFLNKMRKLGFDKVATGHYARVAKQGNEYFLKTGLDNNKDQSYFLCRLNQKQLSQTLFPIGEIQKSKVREIAEQAGLVTASKKDSQGICFIGNIKIRDFLKRYIKGTAGNILDMNGKKVGQHKGVEFFTVGQREGLDVGGTGPYYVVNRNIKTGDLQVTNNPDDPALYKEEITITNISWINKPKSFPWQGGVRIRYRHPIVNCKIDIKGNDIIMIFDEDQKAITPGQSAAFYDDDKLIGSGIIKVVD
jgi:tRNA-uridine 2-sulfurtransferase